MKILQVCSAQTLGGGERHVIDLTSALIERGHELHLAVRKNNALRAELQNLPIKWHEIPLRNALDIFSARALAKIIRAEKIEVMHAHLARDYTSCGFAAKFAPVKFFLTRHHFNPIKANFLSRWALNQTTKLIAVSNSVQTSLQNAFPALQDRIEIIPNWINLKNIATLSKDAARAALGIKRKFAVGMIGQITEIKGHEYLLKAIQVLQKIYVVDELPDFVIVGATQSAEDQKYKSTLLAFASDFIRNNVVHFVGFVPDITTKLAAFDIVVVPSINEGFSLVTVEAMAAGCTIIASNVGALAELISHEKTGLLFPPQNSEALAEALKKLIHDKKLRLSLSQTAKQFARQHFERDQIIHSIEALYQQSQK